MEKKKEAVSDKQPHTFKGLRDILFEEVNLLRSGEISIGRARATSQLARRIIESTTLDMFAQLQLGETTPSDLKRLSKTNV